MVAVLVCIPTNSDSYTHFTLFQDLPQLRLQSTKEFVVFVLGVVVVVVGGGGRFLMYVCVCVCVCVGVVVALGRVVTYT